MDEKDRDIMILAGLVALLAVCGILDTQVMRRHEKQIGKLREDVAWMMDRPRAASETEA